MFNKFSRSLRFSLISKIKEYDVFKEEDYTDFMNLICYKEVELFTTRTGINLKEIDSKKRIEFKYPNGTINPVVIQNNINFFIKLVISIIENKIDVENLDYLISKIEIKDINFFCIKRAKSFSLSCLTILTISSFVRCSCGLPEDNERSIGLILYADNCFILFF